MNQLSLETLKALIKINSDINSDYSNKDALSFRVLKSAMRLICCESACFVAVDDGNCTLITEVAGEKESKIVRKLESDGLLKMILEKKEALFVNDADEDLFYASISSVFDRKIDSFIVVPICKGSECTGIICLFNKLNSDFDENDKAIAVSIGDIAKSAFENCKRIDFQLEQISSVNVKNSSGGGVKLHEFIAESPIILDLLSIVKKAAVTNSSILITGESGVGKELFAEQIYLNSRRVNKPFVRVNCAALTESLMESELFGHVKGAYTSAESNQKGRFEMADGGTIFLDEVGEIPLHLQPKLLRIIQDKQFEKVGSSESISVDVRIIAATNRNLEEMVRQGKFREDLFFRLNVLPIRIPPLRARVEDILPIAESFLKKYSRENGKHFTGFSESAQLAMKNYGWAGNVRELDNAVARACIIGTEPIIQKNDLRLEIDSEKEVNSKGNISEFASFFAGENLGDRSLKSALNAFKRAYVTMILEKCNWNQTKAGKILGIQRTYVSRLMNELHIRENNVNKL